MMFGFDGSKVDDLHVLDVGIGCQFRQHGGRRFAVEVEDGESVSAGGITAQAHARDIHLVPGEEGAEVADDALEAIVNNVSQFITGKGGTITNIERWGKKKLAYPLKHFLEGIYVLVKFKMNARWGKELESSLQISENVLRHLLIKVGD